MLWPSKVRWSFFVDTLYTITNTILSPWNCVAQLSVSQEKNFDNPESNSWSNPTKIRTNNLDWAVTCLFEVRTFIIGAAREALKKLLHYTKRPSKYSLIHFYKRDWFNYVIRTCTNSTWSSIFECRVISYSILVSRILYH